MGPTEADHGDPLARLTALLKRLPGVGEKSALRLAVAIVRGDAEYAQALGAAIAQVHALTRTCSVCQDLTSAAVCKICSDPRRDRSMICVVAQPQDRMAIERAGVYRGLYHVLHGVLDPLAGVGPGQLRVSELLARLAHTQDDDAAGSDRVDAVDRVPEGAVALAEDRQREVAEIIVATSPNVEGDATALYLARLLEPLGVLVSRIATGVAVGGELEYADMSTLGRALADRRRLTRA